MESLYPYYTHAMPYATLERWLTTNEGTLPFARREFAFQLEDSSFLRYYSFETMAELKATLKNLLPVAISLGPVYTTKPKEHKKVSAHAFQFQARELVFDIDLDTYDAIRTCCSGPTLCQLCWRFLSIAVQVIDRALRVDFGFSKVLWVYSGRRGVHAWVCDDVVLKFNGAQRHSLLQYLTVVKGANREINVNQQWDASQQLASSLIRSKFNMLVSEQKLLAEPRKGLVSLLPSGLQQDVAAALKPIPISKRLSWLEALLSRPYIEAQYPQLLSRLHLSVAYPQFDEQVTVQEKHLLRLPFSAHPQTGKICVPLDVATIDTCDPFSIPTAREVCAALDCKDDKDCEVPILRKYIDCLEKTLLADTC